MKIQKEEIKRNIYALAVLLAALLVFGWFGAREIFINSSGSANLLMRYQDGRVRQFTGKVVESMTVLDALWAVSKSGGFEFKYTADKNGLKLLSFDGQHHENPSQPWLIYLNNSLVDSNKLDQVMIKSSDLIEIRL